MLNLSNKQHVNITFLMVGGKRRGSQQTIYRAPIHTYVHLSMFTCTYVDTSVSWMKHIIFPLWWLTLQTQHLCLKAFPCPFHITNNMWYRRICWDEYDNVHFKFDKQIPSHSLPGHKKTDIPFPRTPQHSSSHHPVANLT